MKNRESLINFGVNYQQIYLQNTLRVLCRSKGTFRSLEGKITST